MEYKENKLVRIIKENLVLIVVFTAFFILLRLSPMMYDGWAGPEYYKQHGGLIQWIIFTFGEYRTWINGRVTSNILCGIIESYKTGIIIDIVGAVILTGILESLYYFANIKKNTRAQVDAAIVFFSLIVLMPYVIRTYVIQIALIQYVAPILFLLWALRLEMLRCENTERKYTLYLVLLSMLAGAWMENTSFAYGVVLVVLFAMKLLKNKRIDVGLILSIAATLVMGCIMVFSNGMYSSRIAVEGTEPFVMFTSERLFQHIKVWFRAFIYNASTANIVLFLILAIFSAYMFHREKGMKKGIHFIMCASDIIGLIWFFVLGFKTEEFIFSRTINESYLQMLFEKNPHMVCAITCGYMLWILLYVFVLSRYLQFVKYIYLYAMVAILIMLPTNQMGYRIDFPFYFIVSCIAVLLVCVMRTDLMEGNKTLKTLCGMVVVISAVLGIDYYAQMCSNLYNIGKQREERIASLKEAQFLGTDNKEETYILPYYNKREANQGGCIIRGSFHYPQFLAYYGLDEDTKIVFANDERIYLDCVNENNQAMRFTIINNLQEKYEYNERIYYKKQSYEEYVLIDMKTNLKEKEYKIMPENGTGYYKVEMEYVNVNTGQVNKFERDLEMYLINTNE